MCFRGGAIRDSRDSLDFSLRVGGRLAGRRQLNSRAFHLFMLYSANAQIKRDDLVRSIPTAQALEQRCVCVCVCHERSISRLVCIFVYNVLFALCRCGSRKTNCVVAINMVSFVILAVEQVV